MERIEKCKLAIEKGYSYDKITGLIFGVNGNEIKRKCDDYIVLNIFYQNRYYNLYGHQFAWFFTYGVIVEEIDHINGIRFDNRILNLRSVTHKQNTFNNTVAKGYCFDKSRNNWISTIKVNQKQINLGRFNTKEEARKAYLDAKKIHHVI